MQLLSTRTNSYPRTYLTKVQKLVYPCGYTKHLNIGVILRIVIVIN
jgi:hypothetical protein